MNNSARAVTTNSNATNSNATQASFVDKFREIIAANRQGAPIAVTSVCSAHPEVLTAALLLASEQGENLLIEATSNQVNQYGGYTGMTPRDFIAFVHHIAASEGVSPETIWFGGDHLGPQAWRDEPAESAMAKAEILVKDYVAAGFRKIHLDCSEGCQGEAAAVGDAKAARRAAQLAKICEGAAGEIAVNSGKSAPRDLVYVIGTEVPPPGGARIEDVSENSDRAGENETHIGVGRDSGLAAALIATAPAHAAATLTAHRDEFYQLGLGDTAWQRVIGLVVQPGVEFASDQIHRYEFTKDYLAAKTPLAAAIQDYPGLAFEAHSSDYQSAAAILRLKSHHFAIIKVGPALTFAYRQAIYALDQFAADFGYTPKDTPRVPQIMAQIMQADPKNWRKHYPEAAENLSHLLHYSYADRIRYYWPHHLAQQRLAQLFAALPPIAPRDAMLLPYFAPEILARADLLRAKGKAWPRTMILAQIQQALAAYFAEA